MGWSFTGFRGSNNTKTSGAVLTQAPSGTMAVGAVAVCVCVSDNISAGGGQTNDHVVADFVGNRWKKVFEQSNADVAAAGLTLSVWASRLATQLTSSDNVVFGVRQAAAARAMGLYEYALSAGSDFTFIGAVGTEQDATQSPSVGASGLPSDTYACFAVIGREADNANTYTVDPGFNDRQKFGTSGSTGNTNVSCIVGDKIVTGTGATFNPTNLSAAADTVGILVGLKEVAVCNGTDANGANVGDALRITITNTQVVNNNQTLIVTYALNGGPSGPGFVIDLTNPGAGEISNNVLEDTLKAMLTRWYNRQGLSPAQLVGRTFTFNGAGVKDLFTVDV